MIQIALMKPEHLDSVMEIEDDSFSIPWSRREMEKDMNNPISTYLVVIKNGKVCGYAGMWHVINEGHITNIAVKSEFRRQGLGRMLMEALEAVAKEKEMIGITLEVRMNNTPAQRLYTGFGFRPEGIRKNYYQDTKEDAIIMWKYYEVKERSL